MAHTENTQPATTAPPCVICGKPTEAWPGGDGYGNNPEPWPTDTTARLLTEQAPDRYRCCNTCNTNSVIPLRIARWVI